MKKKLAVLFPGIGYTNDKPLMYYAGKLCAQRGFDIVRVEYPGLRKEQFKDKHIPPEYVREALDCIGEQLNAVQVSEYDEVLLIGKSIGTAIGALYAHLHCPDAKCIWYTPIEATFAYRSNCLAVFHGTSDPWIETETVKKACMEMGYTLYITEGANHSLEKGIAIDDIQTVERVMRKTADAIDAEL